MTGPFSARKTWGAPLALGVLSLVGLVAALVADGWGDALSWIALAVPVAVSVWGWSRPPGPPPMPRAPRAERRAVRPVGPQSARSRRPGA